LSLALATTLATGCRIGFDPVVEEGGGNSDGDGGTGDSRDPPPCSPFAPFDVTSAGIRTHVTGLAWNGTTAASTWIEDPAGASALRYRTFRLDGTTDPIADLGAAGPSEEAYLLRDGTTFHVTWSNDTARTVAHSIDGAPRQTVSASGSNFFPRVAPLPGGGAAFFWARLQGGNGDLAHRLTILDSTGGTVLSDTQVGGLTMAVRGQVVVWTGTELAAFYTDSGGIMLQRFMATGAPIGGPVVIAAVSTQVLDAKWTGDRFLVAWHGGNVGIAYAAADGTLMSPIASPPVGSAFTFQVAIAVGPASDLVVVQEIGVGVHAVSMTRDGTVGAITTLPGAAIDATWADTTWALAISKSTQPQEIEIRALCP
jgi:hypothetical protein